MDGTHRRQLTCHTQFSRSECSLPSSLSDSEEYSTFLVQHLIIIFVPRNQNQRLRNKFIQKSSLTELKLESSCVSPTRNAVQNSLPCGCSLRGQAVTSVTLVRTTFSASPQVLGVYLWTYCSNGVTFNIDFMMHRLGSKVREYFVLLVFALAW